MNGETQLTTISFPFFGFSCDPESVFNIGPLTVHIYGVLIGIGMILAVLYGWKRSKEFGIKADDITDGVLWIVPFAVLTTRLYYCIFYDPQRYFSDPLSILYIWDGGMAIPGGIIGAIAGVAVFCYFKKIKLPALLDLVMLGFLIGQVIGRWGNFFNREAYGVETDFFLKMGLYQNADRTYSSVMKYYHPTFLYESVWNAIGFVLLHFVSKKRKYDGQVALCYGLWYGLGRACIESLRTDALTQGDVRVTLVLMAVVCVACAVILAVMMFRKHDPAKLFVNQVAARAVCEEAAAERTETTEESPAEEAKAEEETAPNGD